MSTTAQIQEIYVGLLGRAADAEGLAYWEAEINGGVLTIEQLRANIVNEQQEWQSGLGLLSREDLVKALYESMFNRAPEAAGLEYWTTGGGKDVNADQLVLALSNGASTTDRSALDNKTDAATFYTQNVDTYVPSQAASAVANVDATLSSLNSAKGAVAVIAGGKNETLTSSADTLTGTANADFFNAPILALSAGDSITGGEGSDTLVAEINGNIADTVSTTSVETLQISSLGAATVDMKNMSGVNSFVNRDSTGALTLNNIDSSAMGFVFDGSVTNNITANYKTGALSGSSDNLAVTLKGASSVAIDVDAGFDSATVSLEGTGNTLTTFTTPGISSLTVSGSGTATIADNALSSITDIIVTATGKITTGSMTTTDVKSISATANTGGLVDADVSSSTGYATNSIEGDSTGLTVLLGSGADNLKIHEQAASGKTSTVKLGSGDDTLQLDNGGLGAAFVFGDDGDDTVNVITTALETTDLIHGGAGTDTLVITGDLVNNLVLIDVENLTLEDTDGAATTLSSSNKALNVVNLIDATNDVDILGLNAGSTVTVNEAVSGTADTAMLDTLTVKFANTEASSTIDVNVGTEDNFTVATAKITDLTLDFAEVVAENASTGTITADDAKTITINSAKDLFFDGGIAAGAAENLTTLTVNASDKVDIGAIDNDAKLATVAITATDNVTLGAIADADKLGTFNVTSTAGTVTTAELGDNAAVLTDPENISVVIAAAKGIDFDVLEADDIGTITMTTTTGDAVVDEITSADDAGTISIEATDGSIDLGNGTDGIIVADDAGVSVNLTAKTTISDDATTPTDAIVTNSKGDITMTLAGAASGKLVITAGTINTAASAGTVDLDASSLTGGLTATVKSFEMKGATATSTISLGAKTSSTVNTITLEGFTSSTTVNGSIGKDTIINSDGGDVLTAPTTNSSDTYIGGDGTDTISYAGNTHDATSGTSSAGATTNGYAMNFTGSQITFDVTPVASATNITYLNANTVAQYDSSATSSASSTAGSIVAGGETDAVSGFEIAIGSAQNDYIAAANTGMQVTGGDGSDIIVLNAGVDTVTLTGAATAASDDTNTDTIKNFEAGATSASGATDDVLLFGSTWADAAFQSASVQKIASGSTITSGSGVDLITIISNGAGSAGFDTGAEMSAFIDASMSVAGMEAIIIAGSDNAHIWLYDADLDTAAAISADDLILIGVLEGVNAANLNAATNFGAAIA